MNKTTANYHARELYRAFLTRAKTETTKADWHAVIYSEDDCVVVTYLGPKGDEDVRQHVCIIRKSWGY